MNRTIHRGGCQCGAVRFTASASAAARRISVCHCRMCQRATGGLHAPLVEFPAADVEWTGRPAIFASSDQGERGFCSHCGTPLFLRFPDGDTVEMMIGAMADPAAFAPAYNYGAESRVPWLEVLAALPSYETGGGPNDGDYTPVASKQTPL